jgi:Flp pilus assembly pilin Flp
MFTKFLSDSTGSTAMEYGLICSLVVGAAAPMMQRYGRSIEENIYDILNAMALVI